LCEKDDDGGGCSCGGNSSPFSMGIYIIFAIFGLTMIRRKILN
jgi:hypothetical protein